MTYAAATGSELGSTWRCPGGLVAAPSRRTPLAPTAFGGGFGGGGGGRATSAVGEPGKGAAALSQARRPRPQAPSGDVPPPPAGPARNAPGVPFGGVDPLYAMGSDGLLRTLRVTDGAPFDPPVPFLPPGARPSSLIWVDGMVYTSTSNNCGNAPNAVWALDLLSPQKTVAKWETGGANVAGTSGPALGTSGIVYAATGAQPPASRPWLASSGPAPARYANSVVGLDRVSLEVKDWFTADGADFNTSPIVFRFKGKDYVGVTGSDHRLLPARRRRARRGGSQDAALRVAAGGGVDRRARARDLAGRRRHALDPGAARRRHHRAQSGGERRQAGARSGLAVARRDGAAGADRRQRRGLRSRERRVPRRSVGSIRPDLTAAERAKRSEAGSALRPRRRDRQGDSGRAGRRSPRSRGRVSPRAAASCIS